MKSHLLALLVVLIFSTSFNQGEKLKSNDRRAAGLMAYPRIGRSDVPVSNLNFNRRHVMEPDTDFQFYSPELDSVPDKDYEDRIRLAKDYRPWQKIDEGRFVYPGSLLLARGSRNSQPNGYTPRLGRENDVDRAGCK
ncbi:CAPA peptides-like isoform X2 [Frieseomelitta varia]|uniref:CAPA peptides-like isoform X2 n=1 Tax=Frieseomelitta varia TaxID=561572 RepID=UPI001CB69D40|nr:CAPA peptides-like isoform X2 [Frieseomelitta varia]